MPSWVGSEDKWAKAKAAAKKSHKESDSNFYAIVTEIYKRMGGEINKKEDFKKGEHLTDSQKSAIANKYKSNPGKWSVRNLAKDKGVGRGAVQEIVKNLPKSTKTDEHILKKQSDNARWKGKKLRPDMVKTTHTARNEEIKTRKQSTMEVPVSRALRAMGIKFKSQVSVSDLIGGDDPEAGVVDYYVPSKKTVILANGSWHTMPNVKKRISKQISKLSAHGIKTIQVSPGDLAKMKQTFSILKAQDPPEDIKEEVETVNKIGPDRAKARIQGKHMMTDIIERGQKTTVDKIKDFAKKIITR